MNKLTVATASAALLACLGAQAARLPLYDDFSAPGIDRNKWIDGEAWRYVSNGKLRMGRWIFGGTASDTGVTAESYGLNATSAAPPKGISATIKVTDLSINEGCAANPSPSRPRARIIAAYFNVRPGGPVPGDRTGDVLAQLQLSRASNSTDADGILRVAGFVTECDNPDCSASTILYSADLGQTSVNSAVTAQIDWDRKNNLFRFTRDKTTSVDVPYTEADSSGPSLAFANVSLRTDAANCTAGRVKAGLSAEFDNVSLSP